MFDLIQTLLATLVALGVLVTIHEWGHFWVARRCGVKVLRFSVGFGKPLYVTTDRHGTEFAVAAIPLGGYVRMLDEREADVPDALKSQAFNNKALWQRIAIVAAGPVVNLLFAVLAYWLIFLMGVNVVKPVIGSIKPDTPAAQVEVPVDYEVVAVNGRATYSWEDVNLGLAAMIGESGLVELRLKHVERDDLQKVDVPLTDWRVNVEQESPLRAFGIEPWQPAVPAVIGRVIDGGRAADAGLLAGDKIVSVNNQPVENWLSFVALVQAAPEQPLSLLLEREQQVSKLVLTPAARALAGGGVQGYVGAAVATVNWPENQLREHRYGLFDGLLQAFIKTGQMISLTLDSIWKMIEGVISVKNLSGPITIAKVAGASAASGLEAFVSFLAYLSISLGVLNLLPIPMLDGGHLLYYFIEAVRGRPVSEKVQMLGLKLGMAVLFSLMAVALFNDVARL